MADRVLREGDIVKTDSEFGSGYWKIVLRVTKKMITKGMNARSPGLYLFYGMWYGDDPMSVESFGKIEELPEGEVEYIGHISSIGCAEFVSNAI